jgi:cytoplasmic tRNA 2-thiolation protein 2
MLHLMQEIVAPETYRTINFFWSLLYVDVGAAVGLSLDERKEKEEQVRTLASRPHGSQRDIFTFKLEQLFKRNDQDTDEECVKRLTSYLDSFKTLSSKEDAFRQLVFTSIATFAQKNKFQYVLTGENASNMAIRVISDISKGRGFNLPLTIAFNDSRWEGITILRPMKDKLAKEIAFYNAINRLNPVFIPNMTTATPLKSSIDRLVEEFITTLQASFPSTVHAILRTTEKLKTPITTEQHNCIMCGAIMTSDETQNMISTLKTSITDKEDTLLDLERLGCMCCDGCKRELDFYQSSKHSSRLLSYDARTKGENVDGLNNSFKRLALGEEDDLDAIDDFPVYISQNVAKTVKMTRESMKESISEFLL